MLFHKHALYLVLCMVIFQACYKDAVYEDDSTIIQIEHPEIPSSGVLVGIIQDEHGNPMANVHSELLDQAFTSGNQGVLFFQVENIDQNSTPILLSYQNDPIFASVQTLDNEVNYFHRTLFTQASRVTVQTKDEVEMTSNHTTLYIPANSYALNSNPFTGIVNVKYFAPDVENPVHTQAIPGEHLGIDDQGSHLWLDYFHVSYINIENNQHDKVELLNKGTAIFEEMDCTGCQVWFFDESLNRWTVHHTKNQFNGQDFTFQQSGFYAIAKSYPYTHVFGKVFLGEKPLIHQPVDIYQNDRFINRVYTTNSGRWMTSLPVDQEYEYRVILNGADSVKALFTTDLPETMVPPLLIDRNSELSLTVSSQTRNCKDQPLDQYFCFVEQGSVKQVFFVNEDQGNFVMPKCKEQDIIINTGDRNLQEFSPRIQYDAAEKEINLNNTYTCNAYKEGYFKLNIDDSERIFTVMESRLQDGRTRLIVYDEINLVSEFHISFSGSEARFYKDEELNILFDKVEMNGTIFEIRCENSNSGCGFESFQIYHYGNTKGDWIQGSFTGEFWVKTFDPIQVSYKLISGEFLVPRSFS